MFSKIKSIFSRKKYLSGIRIASIKEVSANYFVAKGNNGLNVVADLFDDDFYITINDNGGETYINYFTKYNQKEFTPIQFLLNRLDENIFFDMPITEFPYLKSRYSFVFFNHPNFLNIMLLSNESKDIKRSPSIKLYKTIYYPEIKIIKKEVIKNVYKISFCLISNDSKIVLKASFYFADGDFFEIGRLSDFSSIQCIKKIVVGYENYIDTRKVRILKNNYNACLLIRSGLDFKVLVEYYDENNTENIFKIINYSKGIIKKETVLFSNENYIQYKKDFESIYGKRFDYCSTHYPSHKLLRTIKYLKLSTELPLDSSNVTLASMYDIS